ncbi:MAG: hypothetical protein WCF90_01445 [Methanomicrobiales archaeon]
MSVLLGVGAVVTWGVGVMTGVRVGTIAAGTFLLMLRRDIAKKVNGREDHEHNCYIANYERGQGLLGRFSFGGRGISYSV